MSDDGKEDEASPDTRSSSEDSYDDEPDADIGRLLDSGYDQLDGFVTWLEEKAGISTRVAQQDCFNAESLLDYLANYHRKSVEEINEFELRWFMFSHYIRKAQADVETEERLPDSLRRFFKFLDTDPDYSVPDWVYSVIDDQSFYLQRRRDYVELELVDESTWEEEFRAWCVVLEEDLDLRCLWLPRDLGMGVERIDIMGWREATLQEEANQLWQTMRQSLVRAGLDYETERERLTDAYLRWMDTPQERLEGQTPREVILFERQERIEE